ncbi:MAG: tyrosine-type recombinase/integrase [Intestinibaculum porci]|uniref:tyrosine-type recombinase/integrase n=1 Tax=Intestinibaculum porci TaxID=2487118 RepID=UPI003EFE62C2
MDKSEFVNYYLKIFRDNQKPDLVEATIKHKCNHVQPFLSYVFDNDVNDFHDFDLSIVFKFINQLPYRSQTKSMVAFTLRNFFDILHKNDLATVDGRRLFPVIFTNRRSTLPSYYTEKEIKMMLSEIKPNSQNYLRTKTMIMLAAQTGLRASDILQLKLSDIKWDKNLIEKPQIKTACRVSVPISKEVRYLLIAYLRDIRPKSLKDYNEYVFINPDTGTTYCRSELTALVKYYFKKSDVEIGERKNGAHALRHSLATNLLNKNTPMPVIRGILGHKNLNTTSRYLSIDVETLRCLCLEVPNEYHD